MAQLTREAEERIVNLLITEGLADSQLVFGIKSAADASGERVLDMLLAKKIISDDMIARATAAIIGVPYVELKNIVIDQDILTRIPQEASSRVKAVPLGEKDGLLNVAMVDVTNVQAVDYLSNLVNQPIRVWMS
ncbi:type II/IV secretion system protein, partial [Candidatus Saccharibacteria bacterium]|nr:type II/IV secretion system protein [Candidatus Saccharibacteria bacterium]